jgi:hypothetical protein
MADQDKLNDEMVRTELEAGKLIVNLLASLKSKGKDAVPEVIRKAGGQAKERVANTVGNIRTRSKQVQADIQSTAEVVRTRSNEIKGTVDRSVAAVRDEAQHVKNFAKTSVASVKNEAGKILDTAQSVVEVVRNATTKDQTLNPQLSKEVLEEVLAELPEETEEKKSVQIPAVAVAAQEQDPWTKEPRAKSVDDLPLNEPVVAPAKKKPASEELAADAPTQNLEATTPEVENLLPEDELALKETILYGTREGKVFSDLTTEDAIAVNALMSGKVGDVIQGGENLLVRSEGKTLFETDEQGIVTKNIYQEQPTLLNDRMAIKALGLEDLSTHVKFMASTQAKAPEVSEKAQDSERDPRSVKVSDSQRKSSSTAPAIPQSSPEAQKANANRVRSDDVGLGQSTAILATYYDEVVARRLTEMGEESNGRVAINNGYEIVREDIPGGFDLFLDRNDGSEPMALGSYDNDHGWSASSEFAASDLPASMEASTGQTNDQEETITVTPDLVVTPNQSQSQSSSQGNDNSQDNDEEQDID